MATDDQIGGRPAIPGRPGAPPRRLTVASPLSDIPGIGPKRAAALRERGLATAGDLLLNFPSRYLDWRHVKPIGEILPGETVTVAGRLSGLNERPMRGSRW